MNQHPVYEYDLFVIGSGPAGQRAAIQAAKIHKRVGIAEAKSVVGGVCINIGTIPSKTLRENVLHFSGYRLKGVYGASYSVKEDITLSDLLYRIDHVIRHEIDVTHHQLRRNGIDIHSAFATLENSHTIRLHFSDRQGFRDVTADKIMIAVGTRATKESHVPFDNGLIYTSDDIFTMDKLPRTLAVIGAGVIGAEYASIFATLGVRVTLIDRRRRLLDFVDEEIVDALLYHLRNQRVTLRLGESVKELEPIKENNRDSVRIVLESGKQVIADKALYSIGRTGSADMLTLENVGLKPDSRGRLKVNENYQTKVPNIYAVGDVIGFPSLASTSMEQGRMAACHAFNIQTSVVPELFPYGIYTIPEISTCGPGEETLTRRGIPYETGKAMYKEIARGQIIGDDTGLLKLIFNRENRKLLSVHIIGEGASELIHIGQTVLAFEGTIDYFINTVFNYPTLAECYKTAAFDGINRLT